MTLPAALANLDLCSAINRLCIHNDPVELALLTDEQFSTYLKMSGNDDNAKRIICQAAGRPFPGDEHAHRSA